MYCLSKAFFVISGSITLTLCITSLQIDFIIHAAAAVNMVYPYQVGLFSLSAWARGGCCSLVRLLWSCDCLSTLNNTTQYVISMHFSLMAQPIRFFSKMHFTMMCAYSERVRSSPWLYLLSVLWLTPHFFRRLYEEQMFTEHRTFCSLHVRAKSNLCITSGTKAFFWNVF